MQIYKKFLYLQIFRNKITEIFFIRFVINIKPDTTTTLEECRFESL